MNNNLINKTTSIILKLVNALEEDMDQNLISFKDKKMAIDLMNKLFPIIVKLEKLKVMESDEDITNNDLRIINDFLKRNGGSERGI